MRDVDEKVVKALILKALKDSVPLKPNNNALERPGPKAQARTDFRRRSGLSVLRSWDEVLFACHLGEQQICAGQEAYPPDACRQVDNPQVEQIC